METPPERAGWVCGLCGARAEELASPLHPPQEGPSVIRTHVQEAHGVTSTELQDSLQVEATWSLPDGRVWLRQVRSEEV